MSGVACLLALDEAPIDRRVLDDMVHALAYRGPDAQDVRVDGPVGLGHALLRTTEEAASERQPLSLDGQVWTTADCRVDARADLARELAVHGCAPTADAPDPEYLLRAYEVWAERCVEHLLGDFSFVIWDGRRRALFCARDHFGIKPIFYAVAGRMLVISNDLNCLRSHPEIGSDLDEVAIADFLISGYPHDLERTSFSQIRRLPPAHTLMVSEGRLSVRRYWQMPREDEIRYRHRGEYVDRFRELLDGAVRDRLRTRRVGVFMSGGLDSTSVAASARRILAEGEVPFELRAHTIVFDRIVPDEERQYSTLAAAAIGIPIVHYPADDNRFPPDAPEPEWYPAEPRELFSRGLAIAAYQAPVAASRVLLRADGADPLLDRGGTIDGPWRARRYDRILTELIWLTWMRKHLPRVGLRSRLLSLVRKRVQASGAPASFPDWIAPGLERRLDLRARWCERRQMTELPQNPLADPYWASFLESTNPGAMRLPGEVRFPFFDVRLVRYLLRVPPWPWCAEKSLLRIAMRHELPQAILRRPKSPTAGNPWASLLPAAEIAWWEPLLRPAPGLEDFIDVGRSRATLASVIGRVQSRDAPREIDELRSALQPVALNVWLRQIAYANVKADRVSRGG